MMFRFSVRGATGSRSAPFATLATALVAVACSGDSPLQHRIGQGRIVAQVGPGGRVLRGAGGTDLEGLVLAIPAGALSRLVEITIAAGADIAAPGTTAAATGVQMRLVPDPGVLAKPATLSFELDLPPSRRADDLVVVGRPAAGEPSARADAPDRVILLSDLVTRESPTSRVFTTPIAALADFQVRSADRLRLTDDALSLVGRGYEELARMTESSLREADLLFSEAQLADPFAPAANLLRSLSRVLLVLDDRSDIGAGLDSLGEALQASGFDVRGQSLSSRLISGRWPRRVRVPAGAPTLVEIHDLLRRTLRPALDLALRDLDAVPYTVGLVLRLPESLPGLPGLRELDATDAVLLRALWASSIWLLDLLEDVVLEVDGAMLTSDAARGLTIGDVLARFPELGTLRALPDDATIAALRDAAATWSRAFEALAAESDDQTDDLVVFARSMHGERRARWLSNLRAFTDSLRDGTAARIATENAGSLALDFLRPYRAGNLEPRRLLPDFIGIFPVVGSFPDPTLGGILPEMTQAEAGELLSAIRRHASPRLQIVADGLVADWSAAAEALLPRDPVGDVGDAGLRAIDVERVFFADSGDWLALRITLADDAIGDRPRQRVVYGATIHELERGGVGARIDVHAVPTAAGLEVTVERDRRVRAVRTQQAARGRELELLVNRFDLLDPDEPVRDRVVRVFTRGIDIVDGREDGDRTRPVVVRF